MQSTEELENELSEYKSQVKKLQKALEHETEDAKRYYVFWRKYPDLERQNKRLQEQVDAFEAAPLKILDDWIAANGIDLQSGRADALRAYREYLLRSSRSL
jgi:predicted RNase H-like nuclease (RuvC/YqgF family)